ncbi:MAG: hypothetical protein IJB51_09000, partial [Clostridia bacterium]|nr:hypothetical protein [Clostridia bacterium]
CFHLELFKSVLGIGIHHFVSPLFCKPSGRQDRGLQSILFSGHRKITEVIFGGEETQRHTEQNRGFMPPQRFPEAQQTDITKLFSPIKNRDWHSNPCKYCYPLP